jgi:hypothetical protein
VPCVLVPLVPVSPDVPLDGVIVSVPVPLVPDMPLVSVPLVPVPVVPLVPDVSVPVPAPGSVLGVCVPGCMLLPLRVCVEPGRACAP